MEVKELFQLAKGNSSIAKRKSQNLNGGIDDRDSNVAASSVALYLERKKREKELQQKSEDEAKRKRIEARVNSSLTKKTKPKPVEQPKPKVENKPQPKVENKHQPKVENKHQPKTLKSGEFKKEKKYSKEQKEQYLREKKKQQKSVEKVRRDENTNKHTNEHRKEKVRLDEKPALNGKPSKKKHSKKPENTGLSFTDIMKLAKSNSLNPGSGSIKKKEPERKIPTKSAEEVPYDPDRYLKIKRKHKHKLPVHEPPVKQPKLENKKIVSKPKESVPRQEASHKKHVDPRKDIINAKSKQKIASKDISRNEVVVKPKTGLLVETVSVSNGNGKFMKPQPPSKRIERQHGINGSGFNMATGIAAQIGGGIAAQYGGGRGMAAQNRPDRKKEIRKVVREQPKKIGKDKKKVEDYEDEFEKEERQLAKKRKLFEMRRVTGNKDLQEEDLLDQDDYDLDEEDEDDQNFIDDSHGNEDYSRHIRQIFGYDRRRYEDSDSDLDNMESSYSQIEKEENRSARIAKIEDEYERMKEEEQEELQRIKMQKKKK